MCYCGGEGGQVADVIKVINELTINKGDYTGCLGGPDSISWKLIRAWLRLPRETETEKKVHLWTTASAVPSELSSACDPLFLIACPTNVELA